jgi:hypothetical protein
VPTGAAQPVQFVQHRRVLEDATSGVAECTLVEIELACKIAPLAPGAAMPRANDPYFVPGGRLPATYGP